jgi:hypothetical protein
LRELSHGILPTTLTRGGLSAGVEALAAQDAGTHREGVAVGRFPALVQGTAYVVVAAAAAIRIAD